MSAIVKDYWTNCEIVINPIPCGGSGGKGKNAFVHLIDLIAHKLPLSSRKIMRSVDFRALDPKFVLALKPKMLTPSLVI